MAAMGVGFKGKKKYAPAAYITMEQIKQTLHFKRPHNMIFPSRFRFPSVLAETIDRTPGFAVQRGSLR